MMIKIGFPREFNRIKELFPEKEKERDLYIVAEDTRTSEILGAVRFFYKEKQVDIYEMIMLYKDEQFMTVFDGMIRTLLYKMAEEGCRVLVVHGEKKEAENYFISHGFIKESDTYTHMDFPGEFFKPCAGCTEH